MLTTLEEVTVRDYTMKPNETEFKVIRNAMLQYQQTLDTEEHVEINAIIDDILRSMDNPV